MNMRCARGWLLLLTIILCTSCSNMLGYGVLLWSIPDENLYSGDIVPVYIKSNISQVYVIGTGDDESQKCEVPLWQLNVYSSRRKAESYAAHFLEFRHVYAETKRDGLPMRANPDNVSDRTYRLKEGQRVKVIRKGKGATVMSGSHELEGDWLYVLTDDGVFGWCFSYSLRLYDEREEGSVSVVTETAEEKDVYLEQITTSKWYPSEFRTMYDSNRIELDKVNPQYGFFPGVESKVVRIENQEVSLSRPYTTIVKTDDATYSFEGSGVSVIRRDSSTIVVQYADEFSMPKSLFFRTMPVTPDEMIVQETERRSGIASRLRSKGPVYQSNSYGELQFLPEDKFLWSGYSLLSPSIIKKGAGSSGTFGFSKFLHSSLKETYDGVITFVFDASGQTVNFLYRIDDNGIRLEDIQSANIKDNIVQNRNMSPLVLYFTAESDDTSDEEPPIDSVEFMDFNEDF